MAATLLDGEPVARRMRERLATRVAALVARGRTPLLATVAVGADEANTAYLSRKHADCRTTGLPSRDIRLPATISEAALLDLVGQLNGDPDVTAFSVHLPLPRGLDEERIILACDPRKDADGKHPLNLGRLVWGLPGPLPCTAAAVLSLCEAHGISLRGRRVLVIGRGFFAGRPLALLLSSRGVDAVVTIAHRLTPDLPGLIRASDVVIAAAGVPDLVTAAQVKPGAIVIGIGITFVDGEMVSDIADDVASVASHVTPRHGSLGHLTRAHLLENVVRIAEAA